jgi:hypothetical protein
VPSDRPVFAGIEITPEMIEAGIGALARDDQYRLRDTVISILEAMEACRLYGHEKHYCSNCEAPR